MSIEVKIAKIADTSLYLAMLSIVQDRGFMLHREKEGGEEREREGRRGRGRRGKEIKGQADGKTDLPLQCV